MILIPMAAYMLGNAAAARLGRRAGSTALFVAGLAVSLASGAVMAVWCAAGLSVWALFIPMAASSIGNGLSQPAALAAGLSVYPRLAGTASGLMGFLQMAVSALGTVALGTLPRGEFATIAVVGLAQLSAMALGLAALGDTAAAENALRRAKFSARRKRA
jgi:DHA1 family bicyclomycin/chloramphenicol resistance-like MFS transporter